MFHLSAGAGVGDPCDPAPGNVAFPYVMPWSLAALVPVFAALVILLLVTCIAAVVAVQPSANVTA